jgi:hypothetical protein
MSENLDVAKYRTIIIISVLCFKKGANVFSQQVNNNGGGVLWGLCPVDVVENLWA